MTNSQAANLTAEAVTNAIRATDLYFFENPYTSEYDVGNFFRDALISQMSIIGGSISTSFEPFPIPSPAPYITNFSELQQIVSNMKKIILIITLIKIMSYNIEFEDLLGKHLSFAEDLTGSSLKKNIFKGNNSEVVFYNNIDLIEKEFYEMPYNVISVQTSEKDTVQSITVQFNKIINRKSYDLLVKNYGEPNNIQVIKNRQTVSETFGEESTFHQHLKKSTFDLREGSFDERPLYIIWHKENFEIKAFFRHKQNISEITFSTNDE